LKVGLYFSPATGFFSIPTGKIEKTARFLSGRKYKGKVEIKMITPGMLIRLSRSRSIASEWDERGLGRENTLGD